MSVTASEARRTLFPLLKQVNDDQVAIRIVSRHGAAVLMPAEEYDAWQETAHLFASAANAKRLRGALERSERGEYQAHDLIEP
ncbi:MAG: type II toxin-antitoxin system Phd/YefM family antitoxin [Micrococcales bacterium]|nr:type II toxin-antitoxin system Phd/YefM family antitoxin [Micrococcales bacterium]